MFIFQTGVLGNACVVMVVLNVAAVLFCGVFKMGFAGFVFYKRFGH